MSLQFKRFYEREYPYISHPHSLLQLGNLTPHTPLPLHYPFDTYPDTVEFRLEDIKQALKEHQESIKKHEA